MSHCWWWLEAYTPAKRRPIKRVTFAVEADKAIVALRRVHDLGYILDFEDHVTAIAPAKSIEADYRLPLDCAGGVCSLPTP